MKKLILIRPPLFREPGRGKLRLSKFGENRIPVFLGIISQEVSGNALILTSNKETAKATANIISGSSKIPMKIVKELISGEFTYFLTENVYKEIKKEAEEAKAETLIIITGKDLCYDLAVYTANILLGHSFFVKEKFPVCMPKGGIGVVEFEKERVDTELSLY